MTGNIVTNINSINLKKIFISNRKNGNITLNNIGQDKTVYLHKINNCNVYINGKINNIFLEKCNNVNIYFDSIINKFDAYDCGNVYLYCKDTVNTILSEQISSLRIRLDQSLNDLQLVIMTTFSVVLFSGFLSSYIPIKYSMFSDRYQTTFFNNKPIYKSLEPKPQFLLTF